jgi:poly-beta-1,6-N-acetyl-D-glucosamine synthase
MTTFFITVFSIYFLFLVLLMIGWNRSSSRPRADQHTYFLSVIVPFRNEETNLPTLIESLRKLDYPQERFEALLIDDHSTDNSLFVVKQLVNNLPGIKVVSARSAGKKGAVAHGVEISRGEVIITTDADCGLPADWLKCINSQFQNQSIQMIVGAVSIKSDKTFFSKLQVIEFGSLIGSAAATLRLGIPTMCNGANLSYRKEAFIEVEGFKGNEQIASGDDEFLMRKMVDKFGATCVEFLKDSKAVVRTNAQSTVKDFFAQRIRWAGKWRHNSSWIAKILAVFVLLFQFSWLIALVSLFFQSLNNTILLLFIVKILLEGFFLSSISRFMKQKFSGNAFLFLQLVYAPYVIAIGILSTFIPVFWKGRPVASNG